MKNKLLCLFLFFFGLYFNNANCQNAIKEKVQANSQQIESAQNLQLFDEISDPNLDNRIPNTVLAEKQFLNLDQTALQTIQRNQADFLRLSLNIESQYATLNLFKANVVTPDFQVVNSSKESIETHPGLHYWGTVNDDPNSLVSISIFENEIIGSIVAENASYTIGKVKDSETHILYKSTDLKTSGNFQCGLDADAHTIESIGSDNAANARAAINCVGIHVEADYQLYLDFGSNTTAVTNYVNGLFSQVAILYANEGINIAVSYINIWTQPSPYNAGSELADLTAQNYGNTYGNLVHLLHRNSLSGVGYVGVLCFPAFNTSHAGISGTYSNVPTYSNDVGIVTHEIGHNFGSQHTHGCFWNGNNTAIDGCGPASGNNEGCNAALPAAGTIMSYCNLVPGVGIDFTLGFGQQPGDVIRNAYNNATCLSACFPTCTDYPITFNFGPNPEEHTWDILDSNGQVVASGGGYSNSLAYSTVVENVCLGDDCYTLVLNDSGNNGACPTGNGLIFGGTSTNLTGIGSIIYTNFLSVAPKLCSNLSVLDSIGFPIISEFGNFGSQTTGDFCTFNGDGGVPARLTTNTDLEDDKINMTLYPTITNDVVMLSFAMKNENSVNLNIYDATGNLIKSMKNQNIQNGQTIQIDINDLPNGSYFIKMSSYKYTNTQRFFKF